METSNKTLLKAISGDRALGSSILFNHRHTHASPCYHIEIIDLWRCADEFVLIEAFRDAAKSTLSEEFLLMEGCFGNFHYCLLVGETYAKACQRIEAISFEATHNTKLRSLFGKILSKKPIENKVWFESGALIEGIGWEQEIRGFKHLDRRPDRAYWDDVENLERVRSTEAVDATMRKFWRELVPAMDSANRKIRITQTPLSADCAVTRFRSTADFVCRAFPICSGDIDDPKTVSAWPERFPMEWIRSERNKYQAAGMLREFMQERMLNVESLDSRPFSEEMLRSVDIAPQSWLPRYGIFDPARTASVTKSDRTGKVVVSRMGSKIIVHESSGEFWKPDEIRNNLFDTWEKHRCAAIGVEKNSLDEFLLQPIRYEMMRRGVSLPIKALQAPQDRDKRAFIMGLHPFFTAGDVILVGGRGMHPQLVAEILNFPGGRLDILNALAYSLRMFGGQPVYEDFGEANIQTTSPPAPNEVLYVTWSANSVECVAAVVSRRGKYYEVLGDYAGTGPLSDGCRWVAAEIRAHYPRNKIECYVPAELHDEWQRIPLVPALRSLKFQPWRADHTVSSRGSLTEIIRTEVRGKRLLTVDKRASGTLNALAAGYCYAVGVGGAQKQEPEAGQSKLMAEALETLISALSRSINSQQELVGAHFSENPQGIRYSTSLPRRS